MDYTSRFVGPEGMREIARRGRIEAYENELDKHRLQIILRSLMARNPVEAQNIATFATGLAELELSLPEPLKVEQLVAAGEFKLESAEAYKKYIRDSYPELQDEI